MRIDLVSEHASPLAALGGEDAGGQNVHVASLAIALARLGAEVTVLTRRDDPALASSVSMRPGVEVVHVDAGPPKPLPKDRLWPLMDEFANGLHTRWAHHRPDVVHAHFWMSGYASLRAARPLRLPVALTYHALGTVKRHQQGVRDTSPVDREQVERNLACSVDLVLATAGSEAVQLGLLGAEPDRVVVVPCGVDLASFAPGPQDRNRAGRLDVAVVSRLVERKGIGNVIEALAQVDGATLTIAGGPPAEDLDQDPAVAHFRAVAARHGVTGRVTFLGAVERAGVPDVLRSADVVACCPWYEPFGMVALEAMACGRPVVASAVGGLAETVVDGTTGVHVPSRRPQAIAGALCDLRDDPERRCALGRAGVQRAANYGWTRIAERTLSAYRLLTVEPVGSNRPVGVS